MSDASADGSDTSDEASSDDGHATSNHSAKGKNKGTKRSTYRGLLQTLAMMKDVADELATDPATRDPINADGKLRVALVCTHVENCAEVLHEMRMGNIDILVGTFVGKLYLLQAALTYSTFLSLPRPSFCVYPSTRPIDP